MACLPPTLFDVAAIDGYNPNIVIEENHFKFSTKRASYINLISDHYKTDTGDVSDQKNIAFLTF